MNLIVKLFLEQLAGHVLTHGRMNSTVAIFKDHECTTTEVDGPEEARRILIDAVRHLAVAVATASEVWIGLKKEGLFVTYEDAAGCEMYMAEIHRDGGSLSLSEWQPQTASGVFYNIFEQARKSSETNGK